MRMHSLSNRTTRPPAVLMDGVAITLKVEEEEEEEVKTVVVVVVVIVEERSQAS